MFMPAGTWFVAEPVWIATQFHGWGVAHSADAPAGQLWPVFRLYVGAQPADSSSRS
jgi:hypothetical protein